MGMRVYAAGHDIAIGGIKRVATLKVLAYFGDGAIFDLDIRLVGAVGSNNSAVFYDFLSFCFS